MDDDSIDGEGDHPIAPVFHAVVGDTSDDVDGGRISSSYCTASVEENGAVGNVLLGDSSQNDVGFTTV